MPNQASAPITVPLQQVYDWIVAGGDPTAVNAPPIVGARVIATLQFNAPTNASPVAYIADRQFQTVTDQNGFWSLMLAPNTGLSPSGTTWLIQTPQNTYEISVGSAGPYQSSSILVNTPSTLSPAVTGLTGPITVAGNETVTGNLTVSGTTSLGSTTAGATTLGATAVGGDLTVQSAFRLLMLAAASKLVPGATSFSVRDNADANDNLIVTNAGAATVRNGLTVTASDIIATAGRLVLNAAAAKIKGGATSLSLRNNADSADNLLLADGGAITARGTITAVDFAASGASGSQIPLRLLNVGTVITGSSATLATSKFLMQAFTVVGTTDSGGHLTITYPTAFPNGIYSIVASPGDTAGGLIFLTPALAANLTSYVVTCWTQSAGAVQVVNTMAVRVNTIAVGW